LGAVGFAEPSLMFLAGTDTRWLSPEEGARELLSGAVRTLLVADPQESATLAEARKLGMQPVPLAVLRGYNYSRGRFVTLWAFAREKQISAHPPVRLTMD